MVVRINSSATLEATIETIGSKLSLYEKDYALGVCETVLKVSAPAELCFATCDTLSFSHNFSVKNVLTHISNELLYYITGITYMRFMRDFNIQSNFELEIIFVETIDNTPTDEIPPMYWGENLKDNYIVHLQLKNA